MLVKKIRPKPKDPYKKLVDNFTKEITKEINKRIIESLRKYYYVN